MRYPAIERVVIRLERLEKALTEIINIPNSTTGGDWDEIELAREIAKKALNKDDLKKDVIINM